MSKETKSVTMKDVAAATNLSAAAVSMALRGHDSIPLPTQERVQKAAQDLGYVKNPMLMALATQRSQKHSSGETSTVAFITNASSIESFESRQHMHLFYHGFSKQAAELGCRAELIFVSPEEEDQSASLETRLAELNCSDIVLGAINPCDPMPVFDWGKLNVVKIDSSFMELEASLVTNDQLQGIRLAYSKLRELGYNRIGLVTGDIDEATTSDVYTAGYLIDSVNLDPEYDVPPLFYKNGGTLKSQSDELVTWVKENRVEAFVSNWSGMVERAEFGGLEIPKDVAFVNLCLESKDGREAGVVQSHENVGRRAAEVLINRMNEDLSSRSSQRVATYVKGYWVPGATAPVVNR